MAESVVITTDDLDAVGTLRPAFEKEGYRVELLAPGERVAGVVEPALLVLTGDPRSERSRRLAREAREKARIPVFGLVSPDDSHPQALARELHLDECFRKPADPDEVVLIAHRVIERRRLQEITGIVGESETIREVLERVVQSAPADSTVLITGESGTGKELLARGIHALSPRRHRPFIAVNLAALAETLLESELFGHEKGAFTGAIDSRRGFFELADRGTIFLDEVGEMPLATQTRLLRVLEQQEFLRVGGERTLKVNVRIIAATNQDLRELVALGRFRRDLYYRLNVLHIHLPPLRERTEDVPLLVDAFIQEASARHDRRFAGISPEAMEIFRQYHWPGNIRELRNLIESMVVLSPGRPVQPQDIPEEVRLPRGARALLPVPRELHPEERAADTRAIRPQLEFIFRTLVELRVDLNELAREFEAYRREHVRLLEDAGALAFPAYSGAVEIGPYAPAGGPRPAGIAPPLPGEEEGVPVAEIRAPAHPEAASLPDGVVVYRPGMTLDDLEREAIIAALRQVGGNRRKAAESLGIGERTLYRKLHKYKIDFD
ncbi:MAG: sigma-54-dependent Fis family transcriptional regulator [Gemmatimonadetes bacterium]|nr:sigma-54-dependent Fis family transcriptional regulator [Gemmatimonadota bacterium]